MPDGPSADSSRIARIEVEDGQSQQEDLERNKARAVTAGSGLPPGMEVPPAARARTASALTVRSGMVRMNSGSSVQASQAARSRLPTRSLAADKSMPEKAETFFSWVYRHLGPRLYQYAMDYWPPLFGMATLGYAFTVPSWLMGFQLVAAFLLLPLRLWEVLASALAHAVPSLLPLLPNRSWVYEVLTGYSFLVGAITTIYKVIFEEGGNLVMDDLAYFVFSVGGAGCLLLRRTVAPSQRLGVIPGSFVLVLVGGVATVSPSSSAAQIPYVVLFMVMLWLFMWRCKFTDLGTGPRLCLLLLTTVHLSMLLALSATGPTAARETSTHFYGQAGRTISCARESSGTRCGIHEKSTQVWTGFHVGLLLLLYVVLANTDVKDNGMTRQLPTASSAASHSLPPSVKVSTFLLTVLSGARIVCLVVLALAFPSLATLPALLAVIVTLSPPLLRSVEPVTKGAEEDEADQAGRAHMERDISQQQFPPVGSRNSVGSEPPKPERQNRKASGMSVASEQSRHAPMTQRSPKSLDRQNSPAQFSAVSDRITSSAGTSRSQRTPLESRAKHRAQVALCFYTAIALLAIFTYGVLDSEFFFDNGIEDVGLRDEAVGTDLHDKTWEAVTGLNSRPLCAITGILLALACIEVTSVRVEELRLRAATMRSLRHAISILEECVDVAWAAFPPFVGMLAVFFITLSKVVCHGGYSSIVVIGYFVLLALLLITRPWEERGARWKMWLWVMLQLHAALSLLFAFLLFVLHDVHHEDVYRVLQEDVRRCSYTLQDIVRHFTIMLCARMQIIVSKRAMLHVEVEIEVASNRLYRLSNIIAETATGVVGLPGMAGWIDAFAQNIGHTVESISNGLNRLRNFKDEALGLLTLVTALLAAMTSPTDVPSLGLLVIFAIAMLAYNLEDHREQLLMKIVHLLQVSSAVLLMWRGIVAWPAFDLPSDDDGRVALGGNAAYFITLEELGMARPMRNPPTKEALLGLTALLARVTISTLAMVIKESERRSSETRSVDGSDEQAGVDREDASPAVASHTSVPRLSQSQGSLRTIGGDPWEVAFLSNWAPAWLSNQAHPYFSVLLLIVGFAFSIGSATILNAVMIMAVISLCSWSSQWVQAGNVVSVSTVFIMLLQYIARFQSVRRQIDDKWLKRSGLEWSGSEVVKHCLLLGICFMQKQLWYRSRRLSRTPRNLKCPAFLARHADVVGMTGLLLVAVARRHVWSPILVLSILPWFLHDATVKRTVMRSRMHQARFALFVTLMLQVAVRLSTELFEADNETSSLGRLCRVWVDEVKNSASSAAVDNSTLLADTEAECINEWRSWLQATKTTDIMSQWFFDFFALLCLGLLQLLLKSGSIADPVRVSLPRKTMVVMYWWPCVVWFLVLMVSLQGGTLLGISHLILLLGLSFNSDKSWDKRVSWVRRTRWCATAFLFMGLCVQSPMLPCSRAYCAEAGVGGVHRTFLSTETCEALEVQDLFRMNLDTLEAECGSNDAVRLTLGHDTSSTLASQVMGFHRVGGYNFSSGFTALFSQLGLLVAVVLSTTVQLRIYHSEHYRKRVEESLLEADHTVRLERARRYVHEFHCRCSWEVQAQRVRKRVLRTKLKRTIWTINEILSRPGAQAGSSQRYNTQEVLQLHMGVGEDEAQAVTADCMFGSKLYVAKQYLKIMQQVALGRQRQEDAMLAGYALRRKLVAEERSRSAPTVGTMATQSSTYAARRSRTLESQSMWSGSRRSGTVSTLDSGESTESQQRGWIARAESMAKEAERSVTAWWAWFKRSTLLTSLMQDYIFLGVDEFSFTVRAPSTVMQEDLHAHRQGNQLIRIIWKIIISHAQVFVAFFTVWSFIQHRSVLDMVRIFMLFFCTVWVHPFPPHFIWKLLQYYSAMLLLMRTLCNLPIFCSGLSFRRYLGDATDDTSSEDAVRSSWDPEHVFSFCPVQREVTFDVVLGIARKSGPAALEEVSWLAAVGADHICLLFLLVHEWALTRQGMWDYVVFDRRDQQVYLVEPDDVQPSHDPAFRQQPQAGGADVRGPSITSTELEQGFDTVHPKLIDYSIRLHNKFVREYEQQASIRRTTLRLNDGWAQLWRKYFQQRYGHLESDAGDDASDLADAKEGAPSDDGSPSDDTSVFVMELDASDSLASDQPIPEDEVLDPNGGQHPIGWRPPMDVAVPAQSRSFQTTSNSLSAVLRWIAPVKRKQVEGASSFKASRTTSRFLGIGRSNSAQTSMQLRTQTRDLMNEAEQEKREAAALVIQLRVRQWLHWLNQNAWRRELRCDLGHQLLHKTSQDDQHHHHHHHQHHHHHRRPVSDSSPMREDQKDTPRDSSPQRLAGSDIGSAKGSTAEQFQHIEDRSHAVKYNPIAAEMGAGLTCDLCCLAISKSETRWSCDKCDYHVCESCVVDVLQRGVALGSPTNSVTKAAVKSGVPLYILKYLVGFYLLVYALFAGPGIVNEGRSLQDSILENSFSLWTLLFVSVHLGILILDRIFHKLYYRRRSKRSQPTWYSFIVENLALGLHFTEVIVLHVSILVAMSRSTETTVDINMWNKLDLCFYYIGWMIYLCICFIQEKYGRPVIDMDLLRPMEIETLPMVYAGKLGVWLEQIQAVCFLIHYHTPFVDDLRVIIDWSVMPTSLDLWMYYKVEDAHTSLFRTRHHMFVRRGYFFAERRSSGEKMYSGWCLLFGIIFVILMPMVIFSPIAPFRSSALINAAPMTLSATFARPCDDAELCRTIQVPMYKADPMSYSTFSSGEVTRYQSFYNDLSTDTIDVQNLTWPLYSEEPMEISSFTQASISSWLSDVQLNESTVKVVFEVEVELDRGDSLARLVHTQRVCYCSPSSTCRSRSWPQGSPSSCHVAGDAQFLDDAFATLVAWWETDSASDPFRLSSFWATRLRITSNTIRLRSDSGEALDVGLALLSRASSCVNCTDAWGRLQASERDAQFKQAPDDADALSSIFELERITQSSILSGSYGTVIGLYAAVVFVIGRYLREAFMDSSKKTIYEEIPNVGVFLDLAIAVRIARDHRDLRTEFQLYYCLMKVLRSTNLLLTYGGQEVSGYGFARTDHCPPECVEPMYLRKHASEHKAKAAAPGRWPLLQLGGTAQASAASSAKGPPRRAGTTLSKASGAAPNGGLTGSAYGFSPPARVRPDVVHFEDEESHSDAGADVPEGTMLTL